MEAPGGVEKVISQQEGGGGVGGRRQVPSDAVSARQSDAEPPAARCGHLAAARKPEARVEAVVVINYESATVIGQQGHLQPAAGVTSVDGKPIIALSC